MRWGINERVEGFCEHRGRREDTQNGHLEYIYERITRTNEYDHHK